MNMLHVPTQLPSEQGEERLPKLPASGERDPRQVAAATLASAVSALRRRKTPMLVCAITIPLIALIALQQVTPRYTATGSVVYEPTEYAAQELQSILHVDPMTDS